MRALVLLSAPDCHLCRHARDVLDALEADGLLRWRELDADSLEGQRLAAGAPPLRPLLLDANGAVIAYGRLSQRRLARDLDSVPAALPGAAINRSSTLGRR